MGGFIALNIQQRELTCSIQRSTTPINSNKEQKQLSRKIKQKHVTNTQHKKQHTYNNKTNTHHIINTKKAQNKSNKQHTHNKQQHTHNKQQNTHKKQQHTHNKKQHTHNEQQQKTTKLPGTERRFEVPSFNARFKPQQFPLGHIQQTSPLIFLLPLTLRSATPPSLCVW